MLQFVIFIFFLFSVFWRHTTNSGPKIDWHSERKSYEIHGSQIESVSFTLIHFIWIPFTHSCSLADPDFIMDHWSLISVGQIHSSPPKRPSAFSINDISGWWRRFIIAQMTFRSSQLNNRHWATTKNEFIWKLLSLSRRLQLLPLWPIVLCVIHVFPISIIVSSPLFFLYLNKNQHQTSIYVNIKMYSYLLYSYMVLWIYFL